VILQLTRVHPVLGVVGRVLIEIWEENGLAVRGLDMFAGATIAVAAGADFVVKRAVYFVLLGAEDGGEVVCHFCGSESASGLVWWLMVIDL